MPTDEYLQRPVRVIQSCRTLQQLASAVRYATLWLQDLSVKFTGGIPMPVTNLMLMSVVQDQRSRILSKRGRA